WEQYRDYLYRCCIKWMGGNPIDAEDALSRAMLKAWEKVQKFAGQINNFKGWLTSLTRNLCVDIHRERSRGANRVEDIEGYASGEESELVGSGDTPEKAVETDEKRVVIRRAINNLSPRLRETFILHFYQDLSYSEIAQQQEISYQNVCKRISQARKILREELRGYFVGEETNAEIVVETDAEKSKVSESAVGEISQENGGVEPIVGETVSLSEVVETVGEEAMEDLSYPDIVQQQEISYQNVCKHISLAWKILCEKLRGYFIRKDDTYADLSATSVVTKSVVGEISQGNGGIEPIVGETVSFSEVVEEVETIGEEVIEDLSYAEIAQQQDIFYQNICKCIFLAWKVLREQLRRYFSRKDGTNADLYRHLFHVSITLFLVFGITRKKFRNRALRSS
ncbi:MAG: sigma-70 family RNA polymerase sigma factor, partial [Symploca sp. SIO1B1]|nr:sigma-70 family RNA polymerase sigma factor [Symploca sp. SIO1B1]